MIAEIIASGSEMLTPYRQDTNSLFLTEGLNDLGVVVAFKTIVGDSLEHLTAAARTALTRADIVIFSGGLGPTEDDQTREAAAAALDLSLQQDAALLEGLRQRFAARNIPMPSNNQKQADVLTGATLIPNENGSASGQFLDTTFDVGFTPKRRIVVLLPGPPRELKPMFTNRVKPILAQTLPPSFLARRLLRMALLPESLVDGRTSPIYKQFPDVDTTILAGSAEIQLHFACVKPTREEAEARVNELSTLIEHEMDEDIFSSTGESLEEVVLLMLGLRHLTLASAESCTGGLLAGRFTGVAGSSRYFLGGAVVYCDSLKTVFAGVPPEVVVHDGPVSEPVARLLAEGIRERTGASIGVSITGIAGPGPGTGADTGKPLGLVYIGIADAEGSQVKTLHLTGDRERIRFWATQHALEFLRRHLL